MLLTVIRSVAGVNVRIRSPKSSKASLKQVWRPWLLPNPLAGVEFYFWAADGF